MSKMSFISNKNNTRKTNRKEYIEKAVEALKSVVVHGLTEEPDFAEYEEALLEICNEASRRILCDRLAENAKRYDSDYLLMDGVRYKRHALGTVEYHSLCGSMRIARYTYRQTGVRNGPTVVPMELCAGLVERATPALAFRAALGDAQCPGRQWEEQMRASHRRPPSRSTLERIAKKIGTAVKEVAPKILPLVRSGEKIHEEAVALSIGLDRTTIPMEEKLRGCDGLPPLKRRKKPYVRKAPTPVEVNYRMGYVGTVSAIGADGECIKTYRYGCSADADPANILKMMTDDLIHIQKKRKENRLPLLPMGIIQDGAPEMWNLVEPAVQSAMPTERFEKAIDRFHLSERLAESLKVLKDPFLNRDVRLRQWASALEHSDGAINKIERFIIKERNRLKKTKQLGASNAEILRTHLAYIKNNKHLMRYASLRKLGLPTGSGATEGACKSLIMIRAKGCGQRWHSGGVNSVLSLRSLYQSDRLSPFWKEMHERQKVSIQEAA